MSNMTLIKVLRDMGESVTAHGFRSNFRDWVSEETQFSGDLAEAALAHAIKNKVEAAYRRGNLLEKRRELMDSGAIIAAGKAPRWFNSWLMPSQCIPTITNMRRGTNGWKWPMFMVT
jgi:hypothetical protein